MTLLSLAPNLNLRPMRAAWFQLLWLAAYITATSEWPPNFLLYQTTPK